MSSFFFFVLNTSVIFELSGGNAEFTVGASYYHGPIKPSSGGKISPNDGIGTGPYVLKEFEPGVRFFGTRNPNYFKADRAWFDEAGELGDWWFVVDHERGTNPEYTIRIEVIYWE